MKHSHSFRICYIKNECECFIRGSKHRETDESTRPQAFNCFEVFGTHDETRSTSFCFSFLTRCQPLLFVIFVSFCYLSNSYIIQFSVEMDESSLRIRIPKTFDKEKACVISSISKSTVYKNK